MGNLDCRGSLSQGTRVRSSVRGVGRAGPNSGDRAPRDVPGAATAVPRCADWRAAPEWRTAMHRQDAGLDQNPLRPVIRRRASARQARGPSIGWLLDAHSVAVLLGTLAALGLVGATLSFVVDLFVAPWRLYTSDLEESLHLLASVIGLAGAFRLGRGAHQAKQVILVGLALNVGATLAFGRSTVLRPESVLPLVTWVGLAALTVAARVRYP